MYSSPIVKTFVSKGLLPDRVIGLTSLNSLFSYFSSVSDFSTDNLVHFFIDVLSGKLRSDYDFLCSNGFKSPIVSELFKTYFNVKRDLSCVFLVEPVNVCKRCDLFGKLFSHFNIYVNALYDSLAKKFPVNTGFSVVFD